MGTSSQMLAKARASLNTRGRPNAITRDYATRHGNVFLREAWCDMSITYWARRSDNVAAVLPGGDRAYTVWHAEDFQRRGTWVSGTKANVDKARPGDVVFFDWGGTDSIGRIDHVGVVERVLGGGRVQTIEGNTSDMCARRVRSYGVIAGLGRPSYTPPKPFTATAKWPYRSGTVMRRGWANSRGVEAVQKRLGITVDGDFGPATEAAVRAYQKRTKGLTVDGEVGTKTWARMFEGK